MPVLNRYAAATAVAAAFLLAGAAEAQVTEIGDAGQTVGSTQSTRTGTGTAITSITGSIGSASDVDLYTIYIANPGSFSASTANDVTGTNFDTKLYLFDAAGHAIAAADDTAMSIAAVLPGGNGRYAMLAAGNYILGISNATQEPTNGPPPNQDLFAQASDTTAIRGPASGLNPTTLGGYFTIDNFVDIGAYRIDLAGVTTGPRATGAVPEPQSWALLVAGFAAAGASLRRRRAAGRALA